MLSRFPARAPQKNGTSAPVFRPERVLMIDIGGSNIKVMTNEHREMRKTPSSRSHSASQMVAEVLALTDDWEYEAITMGFPGLVKDGHLTREPLNLGGGWLGFDFDAAFGCPVRIINDAALQALAAYEGGRMLFIGFGTSIGASPVADGVIVPMELGLVPLMEGRFMTRLTKEARKEKGQKRWAKAANEAIFLLQDMFFPEDTVIGGGNGKHIDPLPARCRRRTNEDAIIGALRLWDGADMLAVPHGTTWYIEPFASRGLAHQPSPDSPAAATTRAGRAV